jgi:uncharacterized protein (DUF1015 family)
MKERINTVRPFKAYHFNPEKVKDIGLCLSQPYDVISPEMQNEYYKQSEYNIVRLILNRKTGLDNDTDNPYTRALDTLKEWRSTDVLHLSEREAFYAYEQEFNHPRAGKTKVRGFIGKVRLQDYDEKRILPHEKVLKNPVEDRIRLTRTTNTQFEYIWGLYRDKGGSIDKVLVKCGKEAPIIEYYEKAYQVRHKLWKVTDPQKCKVIEETAAERKIYIADGHHRYQTMLNIRDEMRARYPDAGPDAPWEFIMMFLVNSEHEGLVILPTHRMLHHLKVTDWDPVLATLEKYFDLTSFTFTKNDEPKARTLWLKTIEDTKKSPHRFGLCIRGKDRYYVLTLREEKAYERLVKESCSNDWKMLDVNIVNNLVFREILEISEEELSLNACTA